MAADPADVLIEPVPSAALRGRLLEAAYRIYCAALVLDPESKSARAWRDEWLEAHSRREDFSFLVAREGGEIVGFVYGYTGSYGQWWTERVATGLDEQTRADWLDPPHFEVCELHVRPDLQRRGIGARLLDELLASQPHDRVLLTANPAAAQPLPFYRKHGWRELADVTFGEGYPRYVLLGKLLS